MTGIVFLLNITYAPYINKYIDVFKDADEEFEVIYWDRLNQPDAPITWNTHVFNHESKLSKQKVFKFVDFLSFRKYVKKTIYKNKYDKLIILTTLTGILLYDVLEQYKGKYILDIRDYTYENFPLFKKIENRLIKNSSFTVISSIGFKNFLPDSNKYIISHNFIKDDLNDANKILECKPNYKLPLSVGYLGSIRHYKLDVQMIKKFYSDNRFKLSFHGDGPTYDKITQYCNLNKMNVLFSGRYTRKDKLSILNKIDIINAYYDENNFANKFAISNKYYDSLIFKKPILVNSNVYIGNLVKDKNLGFSLDINDRFFLDKLYEMYNMFNFDLFYERAEQELKHILQEDDILYNKIHEFITTS